MINFVRWSYHIAYQANILTQILKEINRHEFKKQVSKYSGDHKTHKLSCFNLLTVMMYTHLKANITLRRIVTGLGLMLSSFYHLNLKSIKRSTLSDALKQRDSQIYEEYYYSLLKNLNREQRRKFGNKINIIDSSTISLCVEKFNWVKYKSTKGGIKLHTMIDGDTRIPEQVIITDAKVHDINGVKKKIKHRQSEIYVYDRGYACYEYLYDIELQGAFFITRLKSNWKTKVLTSKVCEGTSGLFDEVIEVDGPKHAEYPTLLQVVTFYHEESDKILKFLTNNFKLTAECIAEIYKYRWQIELFFKWIKQHLKITSFLSTSKNGVKTQIWCALITYLLLNIIKNRLIKSVDLFEIYRRLALAVDKRIGIYELIANKIESTITTENVCDSGQMELHFA
ncbi:MAG: IS4 family transposase [Spirochaetota bacterium]